MSEFENIVPPNEETPDIQPNEPAQSVEENIPKINPTTMNVLTEPINPAGLISIAKKYRKIIALIAIILAVIIALCSVFSSGSGDGKTLFVDDMLVFTEINVENNTIMYGVIDKKGEIVIDADFTYSAIVGNGMIVAQEPPMGDGAHASSLASYGLIDSKGTEITKFSYSDCGLEFTEGMLPMAEDGKWGFADKDGKWVIEPKFDGALSFYEGLAGAKDTKSRKWGFIDDKGKWEIKAEFEDAGSFKDGIAPAKLDGKWGFVDKDGKWAIKNKFLYVNAFSDKVAIAQDINENWGTIDEKGEWIIKPRFQEIKEFSDGVAAAKKNGKWGFIDKDGKWIIDNDYYDAGSFVNGLAYAQEEKGGKYGYINDDGKWKIDPKYDEATDFSQGLACVKEGKKYGYINKSGKTKIDFRYKYAMPFYADGYAPVLTGGKNSSENDEWFVIDTKGKSIFEKGNTFDGLSR